MMLGVPKKTAVGLVVLFAFGAAYSTVLWGTVPKYVSDTQAYQSLASEIATGHFSVLPYRTMGYPLILALTGSREHLTPALYFVQLLFHLSAVWIVIALAQRFSLPTVASLALAALLLSPPLMFKVSLGLTEAACEFFVALATLFFVRWFERGGLFDGLLAGFAIAFAAVIRPDYELFGVLAAFAAFLLFWKRGERRRATRSALVLIAGSIVLIGGTTVFNAVRFGFPGPSAKLGWSLTTKTASFVEFLPNDEPAKSVLVAARNRSLAMDPKGGGVEYVWPVLDQVAEALHTDRAGASRHMVWLNLRLIASHPDRYAASVAAAAGNYVLPSDTGIANDGGRVLRLVFVLAHVGFLLAFLAQAVGVSGLLIAKRLGAPARGPINRISAVRTWWIAMALIGYAALVAVTVDVGDPRFRTPTDPLILMLVFGGTYMTLVALRARKPI